MKYVLVLPSGLFLVCLATFTELLANVQNLVLWLTSYDIQTIGHGANGWEAMMNTTNRKALTGSFGSDFL